MTVASLNCLQSYTSSTEIGEVIEPLIFDSSNAERERGERTDAKEEEDEEEDDDEANWKSRGLEGAGLA